MNTSLYRRVWRWHFYAGLVCLPFIFSLALTGALYLFNHEIDDLMFGRVLLRPAASATPMLAVSEMIGQARAVYPGTPRAVTMPEDSRHSVQIDIAQQGGAVRQVLVDPSDGAVLGALDPQWRLMNIVKSIHSLSVAGDAGNVVIEIVAGWVIVLAVSGVYLWWPRGRRQGVLAIRPAAHGRTWWRDLHAVTGAYAGVAVLFLALTGMPWSIVWGTQVNRWLSEHGLGVPDGIWRKLPKSTLPAKTLGDVPWTQEQLPLPASVAPTAAPAAGDDPHAAHRAAGHGPRYDVMASSTAIGPDAIIAAVSRRGLQRGFKLTLPRDEKGVYSAARLPGKVEDQRVLHFDQYSGKLLMEVGARDIGELGRLTEWGVSVHQGKQYGLFNQLLMLTACLALMTLCVSGVLTWWRRRPIGKLAAPARKDGDKLAKGVIAIAATLGIFFPLLGASMLLALAADWLIGIRAYYRQ